MRGVVTYFPFIQRRWRLVKMGWQKGTITGCWGRFVSWTSTTAVDGPVRFVFQSPGWFPQINKRPSKVWHGQLTETYSLRRWFQRPRPWKSHWIARGLTTVAIQWSICRNWMRQRWSQHGQSRDQQQWKTSQNCRVMRFWVSWETPDPGGSLWTSDQWKEQGQESEQMRRLGIKSARPLTYGEWWGRSGMRTFIRM